MLECARGCECWLSASGLCQRKCPAGFFTSAQRLARTKCSIGVRGARTCPTHMDRGVKQPWGTWERRPPLRMQREFRLPKPRDSVVHSSSSRIWRSGVTACVIHSLHTQISSEANSTTSRISRVLERIWRKSGTGTSGGLRFVRRATGGPVFEYQEAYSQLVSTPVTTFLAATLGGPCTSSLH